MSTTVQVQSYRMCHSTEMSFYFRSWAWQGSRQRHSMSKYAKVRVSTITIPRCLCRAVIILNFWDWHRPLEGELSISRTWYGDFAITGFGRCNLCGVQKAEWNWHTQVRFFYYHVNCCTNIWKWTFKGTIFASKLLIINLIKKDLFSASEVKFWTFDFAFGILFSYFANYHLQSLLFVLMQMWRKSKRLFTSFETATLFQG